MPTDTTAATYREIFRVREFRALFAAHLLSLIGDQLTKVTVSALVFTGTGSAFLAAVTFGIGYLPWVVLGPVLSALADRFPWRTVMVACDAVRMCLVVSLVIPDLPVADGFRLVTRDPHLRSYLLLGWAGAAFTTAPEGLMTAYAQWAGGGSATIGLLLSAMPLGCMIGAIVYGRFTPPTARWRQVRPMALLSCLALASSVTGPPLPVTLGLLALSGYGTAFQIAFNARFVQKAPDFHRARAFGVASAGMMTGIGLATALAGALTDLAGNPALIVGGCGIAGLPAMLPRGTALAGGPPGCLPKTAKRPRLVRDARSHCGLQ